MCWTEITGLVILFLVFWEDFFFYLVALCNSPKLLCVELFRNDIF